MSEKSDLKRIQADLQEAQAEIETASKVDAILDRLVHNAHRIDHAGESLRRRRSRSTTKD